MAARRQREAAAWRRAAAHGADHVVLPRCTPWLGRAVLEVRTGRGASSLLPPVGWPVHLDPLPS